MDGPLSGPLQESLDNNMAIRQFCVARQEHEEQQEHWDDTPNGIEMWSQWDTTRSPCLGALEQDDFADSFINTDIYGEDGGVSAGQTHQAPDEYEMSVTPNTIFYGEEQMTDGEELELGSPVEESDMGVMVLPGVSGAPHGVDQGLQLVHLLLACAEAVGCRDAQLATSVLSQIWASANPRGDSLQRVSFCFAMGLKSRLTHFHNVGTSATFPNVGGDAPLITREEKIEGFNLLYQTTPYIAFGFMAANEAICQAAQGKDSLHIIDLGMEHALQWPSLIRNLASRPEGPPKLRITGIGVGPSLSELEASMKLLADDASLLGIQLEFHANVELSTPSLLNIESLQLREGDAVFVNSILHLHKYVKESRGSLKAILQEIRKLKPTLLTLVEQDSNHNGPFFLGRFLESLHYYSAIFDSLEASLPRLSPQRVTIERSQFGEEIRNIIACEGPDRVERHERADQWRRQLGRAGFQAVALKSMSQARMLLSVYGCDGYTLASEKGCLLLGWKGRPIMLASAWQVHSNANI